jgi:hypothetical protein
MSYVFRFIGMINSASPPERIPQQFLECSNPSPCEWGGRERGRSLWAAVARVVRCRRAGVSRQAATEH